MALLALDATDADDEVFFLLPPCLLSPTTFASASASGSPSDKDSGIVDMVLPRVVPVPVLVPVLRPLEVEFVLLTALA